LASDEAFWQLKGIAMNQKEDLTMAVFIWSGAQSKAVHHVTAILHSIFPRRTVSSLFTKNVLGTRPGLFRRQYVSATAEADLAAL
jgi:hypothetical protein